MKLQASEIVKARAAIDEKLPLNVAEFFGGLGKVQLDIAQVIVLLHRRM